MIDDRSWRLLGMVEGVRVTGSQLELYTPVDVVPRAEVERVLREVTALRAGIDRLKADGPPCDRSWRETLDDVLNEAT